MSPAQLLLDSDMRRLDTHTPPAYQLDDDLLLLVFAFLHKASDLASAYSVNRCWRAAESDAAWARLVRRCHGSSKDALFRKLGIVSGKAQVQHLHNGLNARGCLYQSLQDLQFVLMLHVHDFSETGVSVGPWTKDWAALDTRERAAAELLGYMNSEDWKGRLTSCPEECAFMWEFLSEQQRAAATLLGYGQEAWDRELHGTQRLIELSPDFAAPHPHEFSLTADLDGTLKLPRRGQIISSLVVQHKDGKYATILPEAVVCASPETVEDDLSSPMRFVTRCQVPWLPQRTLESVMQVTERGEGGARTQRITFGRFRATLDDLISEVVAPFTWLQAIALMLR